MIAEGLDGGHTPASPVARVPLLTARALAQRGPHLERLAARRARARLGPPPALLTCPPRPCTRSSRWRRSPMPSRRRRKPNLGTSSSSWLTISATLTSATPAARSARQTSTGWRTAVLTCSPSCSRRTSGVPVPAACVLYVPEVQGSLPPAPLVRSSAVHQRRYAEGGIPRTVYPPGEQRGEARQLLRPAGVQPDACGAPHGPVQHPVRLPIGRAHRPQQLLSATHRDAAAAVRAAHARREGARGGQVAPGLPPLGAHANLPWL